MKKETHPLTILLTFLSWNETCISLTSSPVQKAVWESSLWGWMIKLLTFTAHVSDRIFPKKGRRVAQSRTIKCFFFFFSLVDLNVWDGKKEVAGICKPSFMVKIKVVKPVPNAVKLWLLDAVTLFTSLCFWVLLHLSASAIFKYI